MNHTATVFITVALYRRTNLQYVQHILKTQSNAFMYKAHYFKIDLEVWGCADNWAVLLHFMLI